MGVSVWIRLSPEAIPHAPDGLNVLRPVGVELDLIPDVLDVDGDGGHIADGLHPPHAVKEPTKPFSPSELVARVKGHIQRYERLVGSREQRRPEVLKIRGLEIDRDSRRVWVNGKETSMTGKEYDLLLFLAEHPDTVFSKDRLVVGPQP